MATRRAKKKNKAAEPELKAVGFLGTGKVSAKATTALLSDFVEAQGPVKFIVPITEEFWTNSMAEVATFAEDNDILIQAVWDGEEDNDPEELLEGEFEDVKTKKVTDRVIKDAEIVIFLWEDGASEELLDMATEAGVTCLDLGEGLQELEFAEVEEGDEEEPEAAEDDAEEEDDDEDSSDDSSDDSDDEDEDDEEFEEIDFATFDIESLDTKDDRDRIMAIGEEMGIETYKGMRVGTMVKEIKKAQKLLAAAGVDEPKAKSSKKADPVEDVPAEEVLDAEVVSTGNLVPVTVNINVSVDDLTEDTASALRDFLASL